MEPEKRTSCGCQPRNEPEVLVLYRKREGARRLHEHGVFKSRSRTSPLISLNPVSGQSPPIVGLPGK